MTTKKTLRRALLMALSAVLLTVIMYYADTVRAVGSFPEAEHRIKLIDHNGQPVGNLTATIKTDKGVNAYNYPFINYQPDRPLVNDLGYILLQHIDLGAEYGTTHHRLFFAFSIETVHPPEYYLAIKQGDVELALVRYSSIIRHCRGLPSDGTSTCDPKSIHYASDLEPRHHPHLDEMSARMLPIYNLTLSYPYKLVKKGAWNE